MKGGWNMSQSKYSALKLENQLCFPLYAAAREVVKKYRPQLDAYAHALSQVLEKPIKEKVVYFFNADSAISL